MMIHLIANMLKLWRSAIYYKYVKNENENENENAYKVFVYDIVASLFILVGLSLLCENSIYVFMLLFVDAMLGASGAMLVRDVYNTQKVHILPILIPFYIVGV